MESVHFTMCTIHFGRICPFRRVWRVTCCSWRTLRKTCSGGEVRFIWKHSEVSFPSQHHPLPLSEEGVDLKTLRSPVTRDLVNPACHTDHKVTRRTQLLSIFPTVFPTGGVCFPANHTHSWGEGGALSGSNRVSGQTVSVPQACLAASGILSAPPRQCKPLFASTALGGS